MIILDNSDLNTVRYLAFVLGSVPRNRRGVVPARRLLERITAEIVATNAAGPASEDAVGLFSERDDSVVITLEFAVEKRRAAQVAALRLARGVLAASSCFVPDAIDELDAAIGRVERGEGLMPASARATTVDDDADTSIDDRLRRYLADTGA